MLGCRTIISTNAPSLGIPEETTHTNTSSSGTTAEAAPTLRTSAFVTATVLCSVFVCVRSAHLDIPHVHVSTYSSTVSKPSRRRRTTFCHTTRYFVQQQYLLIVTPDFDAPPFQPATHPGFQVNYTQKGNLARLYIHHV